MDSSIGTAGIDWSGRLLLHQRSTKDCDDVRELLGACLVSAKIRRENLIEKLVVNAIRHLQLVGLNLLSLGLCNFTSLFSANGRTLPVAMTERFHQVALFQIHDNCSRTSIGLPSAILDTRIHLLLGEIKTLSEFFGRNG